MAKKLTLTGNDLALAEKAAALAITWVKAQKSRSKFSREQIAGLKKLIIDLSAIGDHAYPYQNADQMPLTLGDEPIMMLNAPVVKRTRQEAARAVAREPEFQTCTKCGCTDDDCSGCIRRTGEACHWVKPGLCSACAPKTDWHPRRRRRQS